MCEQEAAREAITASRRLQEGLVLFRDSEKLRRK